MTITLHPMAPERREALRSLVVDEAAVARPHRSPGRRLALGTAVATSAIVVGTGGALLLADRRTPAATGPWSAVPVNAAGPLNLSADGDETWGTQCEEITGGAPGFLGVADDPGRAETRDILLDVRGGYTFCVDVSYGDGTDADPMVAYAGVRGPAAPETAEGIRWGGQAMWGSFQTDEVLTTPDDDSLVMFGDPQNDPSDTEVDSLKAAYGPAGPDVRGVDLILTDATRVTATVANGLWGAWWPAWETTAGVAELRITTSSGTRSVDPETVEYRLPDQAY